MRLVRGACFAMLAGALAACGASQAQVAEPEDQPPIAKAEAEKGASDAVGSIYDSIGHGDSDGLMTLASEDLVVFGPRRADALANRSDALVALGKEVSAKKKPALASSNLQVSASAGGHSAWVFDIVDVGGQPLAVTAVLTNSDDIWLVDAAALARTPTAKALAKELARDAIVPPGMSGVGAKVDGATKAVADKFQRGLGDQSTWGDELGARASSMFIGPDAGDIAHGKKEIKKLWKKRLRANTREVAVGELAGATTPDGKLAWIERAGHAHERRRRRAAAARVRGLRADRRRLEARRAPGVARDRRARRRRGAREEGRTAAGGEGRGEGADRRGR